MSCQSRNILLASTSGPQAVSHPAGSQYPDDTVSSEPTGAALWLWWQGPETVGPITYTFCTALSDLIRVRSIFLCLQLASGGES